MSRRQEKRDYQEEKGRKLARVEIARIEWGRRCWNEAVEQAAALADREGADSIAGLIRGMHNGLPFSPPTDTDVLTERAVDARRLLVDERDALVELHEEYEERWRTPKRSLTLEAIEKAIASLDVALGGS